MVGEDRSSRRPINICIYIYIYKSIIPSREGHSSNPSLTTCQLLTGVFNGAAARQPISNPAGPSPNPVAMQLSPGLPGRAWIREKNYYQFTCWKQGKKLNTAYCVLSLHMKKKGGIVGPTWWTPTTSSTPGRVSSGGATSPLPLAPLILVVASSGLCRSLYQMSPSFCCSCNAPLLSSGLHLLLSLPHLLSSGFSLGVFFWISGIFLFWSLHA